LKPFQRGVLRMLHLLNPGENSEDKRRVVSCKMCYTIFTIVLYWDILGQNLLRQLFLS